MHMVKAFHHLSEIVATLLFRKSATKSNEIEEFTASD